MSYKTPNDLAEILGATEAQILEWRRQYQWPSLKIGKTIRFSDEHVEQIVAQHSVTPTRVSKPDDVVIDGQTKRSARRSA